MCVRACVRVCVVVVVVRVAVKRSGRPTCVEDGRLRNLLYYYYHYKIQPITSKESDSLPVTRATLLRKRIWGKMMLNEPASQK